MTVREQHKRYVKTHYGLNREVTDAELEAEYAMLKRKHVKGTLDDKDQMLAVLLDIC